MHICDKKTSVIREGDLILIHPGQMHRFVIPHDLYMFHCVFEGYEVPADQLTDMPQQVVHIPLNLQKQVEMLYKQIANIDKPNVSADQFYQKRIYLSQLLDIYRQNCTSDSIPKGGYAYIIKTISLLQENNDLSIPDVAEAVGLHPDYLCRLFKGELHVSLMDYKILLRVTKAASLLEETNLSVRQIAEKGGYKKISQFCAQFKRIFYMTPTEYREKFHTQECN